MEREKYELLACIAVLVSVICVVIIIANAYIKNSQMNIEKDITLKQIEVYGEEINTVNE